MSETWEQLLAKSRGPWHTPAPETRAETQTQNQRVYHDTRAPDIDKVADADVAAVFALAHKEELRYIPETKAWAFWDRDKARWVQDVAGDVAAKHRLKTWMWSLAMDKAKKARAAKLAGGATQEEADRAASGVETFLKSSRKLDAVWKQARTEPSLVTSLRHFDADPWTLNTPAGAIDLWTGELHDPTPETLCLKQTAVAPQAGDSPLWDKVLSDAFPGDAATREYVETALSLALVGDQMIQEFYMLSGESGSGKGTIMNTVMSLVGTGETGYAMPVEAEFLMRQRGDKHPEQYARLKGKRLVVSSESDRKQTFDAARVKNLTGDDQLTGRYMRGNSFSFKPAYKLFLMTNYRPRVNPEDGGFWRRFREIPFRYKPGEPITGLQARLITEEGPQILARLLLRLEAFIEGGGMWTPSLVQRATNENKAEQDTVVEFIEQMCEATGDDSVYTTSAALHEAFVRWCRLNEYDSMSATAFGRRVTASGFESDTIKVSGRAAKVRRGLQLVHNTNVNL